MIRRCCCFPHACPVRGVKRTLDSPYQQMYAIALTRRTRSTRSRRSRGRPSPRRERGSPPPAPRRPETRRLLVTVLKQRAPCAGGGCRASGCSGLVAWPRGLDRYGVQWRRAPIKLARVIKLCRRLVSSLLFSSHLFSSHLFSSLLFSSLLSRRSTGLLTCAARAPRRSARGSAAAASASARRRSSRPSCASLATSSPSPSSRTTTSSPTRASSTPTRPPPRACVPRAPKPMPTPRPAVDSPDRARQLHHPPRPEWGRRKTSPPQF